MRVNIWEAKVMVSGGIKANGLSKSKDYPYGVCSLRGTANSDLFAQCGKWIERRYVGVKRLM